MHSYNPLILATQLVVILTLNAQEKQPNIIYLMSTIRFILNWLLQQYRCANMNLDRLSADGIADNHYVSTAICMASRASVMTGMYEYKTGCNFQHGDLTQGK